MARCSRGCQTRTMLRTDGACFRVLVMNLLRPPGVWTSLLVPMLHRLARLMPLAAERRGEMASGFRSRKSDAYPEGRWSG